MLEKVGITKFVDLCISDHTVFTAWKGTCIVINESINRNVHEKLNLLEFCSKRRTAK